MQENLLKIISIIILSIGLLSLHFLLIQSYKQIEIDQDHGQEIFSIQGKVKSIKSSEKYTRINVEYLTTQELIAFDNLSLTTTCIHAIVQKEKDAMIIKKIRACKL